ncbi:MAG: hypothetical protein IPK82_24520 [Polyangiaceae bacterium]|nr:hypothetical protein [Polyangiaceae bacterium]
MPAKVAPPDFRYVSLLPASVPVGPATVAGTLGVAGFGAAFWSAGTDPMLLSVVGSVAAVSPLALARKTFSAPGKGRAREVAMAVVPWGVVVWPDSETRVLRWSAISKVDTEAMCTLRGGTPQVEWTRVLVYTERETFSGRAKGAVGLERLVANLGAYSAEAARPPSIDLDGDTPVEHDAGEPVAEAILRSASEMLASGRGAAQLHLPDHGYRRLGVRAAGPETLRQLKAVLGRAHEAPADPRPLVCTLAALLQARELLDAIAALVSSPHPITAAFAMAAAARLGATQGRAGSLSELAPFLFDEDVALLEAFSTGDTKER